MDAPRLTAKVWVQALLRTAFAEGRTAVVARRGDPDAGVVLIRQNLGEGRFVMLAPQRGPDGALAWRPATGPEPVDEARADAYVARQADIDCDLWVVEIDDRQGWLPAQVRLAEGG